VRVLTMNLLARHRADGSARNEVVRRGLAEVRPDVVALQEVTSTTTFDEARYLLGPEFATVEHPGRTPDGVGACLASRWPIGDVHTLGPVAERAETLPWAATLAVEVAAPDPVGPVLVVHHKPSWQLEREWERETEAVAAARFVEQLVADRPDLPVVLLGDLDAGPEAASVRFLTGRQSLDGMSMRYEDAWEAVHPGEPGHTFTPENPLVCAGEMPLERGRRIDHVMVRSGPYGPLLEVADCRLLFDRPCDGVWASDHFGVVADLRPPPHPLGSWA
jgi:endonuclease/exonuclease/phosphatase family metal-dependent hydrolase